MSKQVPLGSIALLRAAGNPNGALADLMTQVIGVAAFIAATGVPSETVLDVYDELSRISREALITIMLEDADVNKAPS